MQKEILYESVPQDDTDAAVLYRTQRGLRRHKQTPTRNQSVHDQRAAWLTVLNMCCLAVSIVLFVSTFDFNGAEPNWALRQTSFYSPLFDHMKIEFEEKKVAGTLFNEKTLSEQDLLLRKYPNAEVDAAWEALAKVHIVTISTEEVKRLGKDPQRTVKAPPEWGFGDDAHLAQLDGQHALHCLNAVRRFAYRERYFTYINKTGIPRVGSPLDRFDEAHLSHCLHVLLQTLTCNPSMDLITHNWVDTQLYPFPDFAINKKCIKHENILHWQEEHRLSQQQWRDMSLRGPGPKETVLPMPEELRKWSESSDAEMANVE